MKITARISNKPEGHEVVVSTDGYRKRLSISAKGEGRGSSVNGGELLMAAIATCYCNDLFREAAKKGVQVTAVEVEVEGEFGAAGEAATALRYRVRIMGSGDSAELVDLGWHTDTMAEVQNTIRGGNQVVLDEVSVLEPVEP